MLKELMRLWRDEGIMKSAVSKLGEMIDNAQYVYSHAWEACKGQAVIEEIEKPLRQHDKMVNRGEREIRRMLVEHLSINPGKDASGCLAIMVMAKDAERIGDHARNIFDVANHGQINVTGMKLFPKLEDVYGRIYHLLPELKVAILESSDEGAHDVIEQYQQIKPIVRDMYDCLFSEEYSSKEAVISALLVRSFRRINAHIGNIASGIIFPLENIDFVSRGLEAEKKKS